MSMNYQDPDADVLSSSGYGVRGIYVYIAIIYDVNEKAIWVVIRIGYSATNKIETYVDVTCPFTRNIESVCLQ